MKLFDRLKQKSVGYYLFLVAAALDVITLIIYTVYIAGGGRADAIVFIALVLSIAVVAVLFFYEGLFGDIMAAVPAVCFAVTLAFTLEGGVGNIADSVENIVMYGHKELAVYNYVLAVLSIVGFITSAVACFMRRTKRHKRSDE